MQVPLIEFFSFASYLASYLLFEIYFVESIHFPYTLLSPIQSWNSIWIKSPAKIPFPSLKTRNRFDTKFLCNSSASSSLQYCFQAKGNERFTSYWGCGFVNVYAKRQEHYEHPFAISIYSSIVLLEKLFLSSTCCGANCWLSFYFGKEWTCWMLFSSVQMLQNLIKVVCTQSYFLFYD